MLIIFLVLTECLAVRSTGEKIRDDRYTNQYSAKFTSKKKFSLIKDDSE